MRKSFIERDPVPIAVIGLIGIAMLIALSVSWQRLPFVDSGTTYRAVFSDAAGLVPGEEVRVAGVKVGKVSSLALDGDQVVVTFTVAGVDVGDRSEAGIEIKTLLGQHYLSLTPIGTDELPAGATIPLTRTSTPVNIVPTFNRLADQTQRTDTRQVAQAFESLAATLRTTAPQMEGALTGLQRLASTINRRDDTIGDLFQRANRVSGLVAARDRQLGELLTASDQVLDVLARRRSVIRTIIVETRALAGQLNGLVEDNEDSLGPVLDDLHSVLTVLRNNQRNLDQTLTYAAPYAREFTNVGGSGEWFDATMKLPRGLSICSTHDSTDITGGLLDPVLSAMNQAINGSSTPCLPLGPAIASRMAAHQKSSPEKSSQQKSAQQEGGTR